MITILIDPGLFEISPDMNNDDQQEHFTLLDNTISFVSNCIDAAIDEYNGAPYLYYYDATPAYREAPITESRYIRSRYGKIRKEIQKMLRNGTIIKLEDSVRLDCPLDFEDNTVTERPFIQYLHQKLFFQRSECSLLLLLSSKNRKHSPKVSISSDKESADIASVYDPAIDCSGIIAEYIKEGPNQHDMFPRSVSCSSLNSAFLAEVTPQRLSDAEKKSYFKKYGNEVASRNGYEKKPDLSRKNPKYSVFVHPHQEYYLSIDLEHGGLEVFKYQGNDPPHLGEYDYSCQFQKDAEPETHKIIV